jgi:glycosyltransferase involved in cell wall biosynthesis
MRVLYVSQTGMTEPLGQSQVIPYLAGLARAGFEIDLIAFEPQAAHDEAVERVHAELAARGIEYRWLRRSPAHDIASKARESLAGLMRLLPRAIARRPRLIHARATIAATIAHLTARLSPGARFLFDCRGLIADEYADVGYWQRGSLRYRLLKAVELGLFRRADAMVVLTDRLRRWLRDEARLVSSATPIEVIPCCVDVDRFTFRLDARVATRAALGVGDRFVLVYSGSLGSYYSDEEMATLFAALRRRREATFLVLSRSPMDRLRAALRARGVAETDVVTRSASSDEMPALLGAADAAVSFITPLFSKMASSPTKLAEYLAIGLPVAVSAGIGDQDDVVRALPDLLPSAGSLSLAEIERVAVELAARSAPTDDERRRARALAVQQFSLALGVERYANLYRRLAA